MALAVVERESIAVISISARDGQASGGVETTAQEADGRRCALIHAGTQRMPILTQGDSGVGEKRLNTLANRSAVAGFVIFDLELQELMEGFHRRLGVGGDCNTRSMRGLL